MQASCYSITPSLLNLYTSVKFIHMGAQHYNITKVQVIHSEVNHFAIRGCTYTQHWVRVHLSVMQV